MSQQNCLKRLKNRIFSIVLISSILTFLLSFLLSGTIYAQTAGTVSLQGKIVRNDAGYEGLNVVNGTPSCVTSGTDDCNFKVSYYSASTSGTLYYSESFADVEIGDYGGVFNLNLGSGTLVSGGSETSFAEVVGKYKDVYIEIAFDPAGATTYGEVFTRTPLAASAYAMGAGADGFSFYSVGDAEEGNLAEVEGAVYYNTDDNELKMFDGSSWISLSTGGGSWGTSNVSGFATHDGYMSDTGIGLFSNFSLDSASDRVSVNTDQMRGGLSVYSSYDTSGGTWPLVSFKADDTSFSAAILELTQDGTGNLLEMNVGSNELVSIFDNNGYLRSYAIHLNDPDLSSPGDGVLYIDPFDGSLPGGGDLNPYGSEGCVYSYGGNLYWDASCDASSPIALGSGSSSLWTDGGTFTYLDSTTDDLVLGASTTTNPPFFFDVSQKRLGIGTSTPQAAIDIAGASSSISNTTGDITINPADQLVVLGDVELGNGSTTRSLYAYNAARSYYGQLELYNLATGNMTLNTTFDSGDIILDPGSSGGVGIGTNSPDAGVLLDLESSSSMGTVVALSNTNTGGHNWYIVSNGSSNYGGAGALQFYDYTEDATRMLIDSYGNVAIGHTSASYLLDVNSGSTDSVAMFSSDDDLAQLYLADNDSTGFIQVRDNNLSLGTDAVQMHEYQYTFTNGSAVDFVFNSNGTKVYTVNVSEAIIYQYSLSTPWNVSTISYDSKSFDVSAQTSGPTGIRFNASGDIMYITDWGTEIYQYSLSTAWDVSTASYTSKSYNVAAQISYIRGFTFSVDGTSFYITRPPTATVYQYDLSVAWDISTASYSLKSFNISTQISYSRGISFSNDGNNMYVVNTSDSKIYQYSLSTAWDVSTASYTSKSLLTDFRRDENGDYTLGVQLSSTGGSIYTIGASSDAIYQYNLSTAWDVSSSVGEENIIEFTSGLITMQGNIEPKFGNFFDIGNENSRWRNIYAEDTLVLGSSGYSNEGKIKFNTDTDRLEYSYNGVEWIPFSQISQSVTLSAEYPGAVFAADGSSNIGFMTSDAEGSAENSMNYYEWNSSETTLQDYDIRIRFTLPNNFEDWDYPALVFNFMTESNTATNNKIDFYVYGENSSVIEHSSIDQYSSTSGNWQTVSLPAYALTCTEPGDTCVILIRMYSANDNFVRVGDIDINYRLAQMVAS